MLIHNTNKEEDELAHKTHGNINLEVNIRKANFLFLEMGGTIFTTLTVQ